MFPVTLTPYNRLKNPQTVSPPCYGFLKHGQVDGGDDGDYLIEYPVSDGWNSRHTSSYGYEDSLEYDGYQNEFIVSDCIGLHEIEGIWNSGTHFPEIGEVDGEESVHQFRDFEMEMLPINEPLRKPINHVEDWAEKHSMPEVTIQAVMNSFEECLDKDNTSCFLWDGDMFGVKANVAADRCLFYLMLNRFLWVDYEKGSANLMLDLMYLEKEKPMTAFLMARLLSRSKNLMSNEETLYWSGSDNDSCILPMSLISVGHAAKFEEPVQVHWRQESYNAGDGHLRDDDFDAISREGKEYGGLSNSMFLPILHPQQSMDFKIPIKEEALFVAFSREISLDEATFNRLTSYDSRTLVNSYRFLSEIQRAGSSDMLKTKPKSEWVVILKNLLLSK